MKQPFLALIRLYQVAVSPALGVACRFEPTCSHYAYGAIERHGVVKGVWMAARRLARCRPGGSGGYDPVPGSPEAIEAARDDARESAIFEATVEARPHA
jgi:uncharacterized protein